MRASKENAKKMIKAVKNAPTFKESVELLKFLDSCDRKLPSEAAYERERKRKRT